jgi:hypothetical protein
MEYIKFHMELKAARISIKELARLLGMNPASITNYKRTGKVPRYLAVIASLIGVLATNGNSARDVLKLLSQRL